MTDLPALLGGSAVRPEGPPAWPLPDSDVQTALATAIANGAWGQYHGEHVCALEAELAAFHGVPHVLTCASGTLAVEVALRALRVGPGDEVILAAYEYESNFLTVHALGAKPVLVDIHPHSWQLDHSQLEAAFTPQTKAVLCSHLHAGLVSMQEVTEIARRHNVVVIEDAAQAPGATVQGKLAGTWGAVGTLSFGGSKLLTSGRGGALLFADSQLYQRAKLFLHRGLQQWAPLSELQAAALRPQLRKLPEMNAKRAENVRELLSQFDSRWLRPLFRHLPGEALPPTRLEDSPPSPTRGEGKKSEALPGVLSSPLVGEVARLCEPVGGEPRLPQCLSGDLNGIAVYKLGFQFDPGAFGLSRELFVKAMRAEGVAFDAGFKALHVGRSPSRFRAVGELPHATAAHERCVMLHHPVLSLSRPDILQVAEAIAKVYRYRDMFADRPSDRG